ncbi:MAG TPA: phosphotransferase [Verrucomicrobiota bacterium]|nr:phosphotransferase [Verrucomicrobiota bacterium]
MSRIEFFVSPQDRQTLDAAGLRTFEDLMSKDCGSEVSSQSSAQVRRLELPTEDGPIVCFLKRTLGLKPRKSFRFLLHGRIPHTSAYREMRQVFTLRQHGVPTMRVMAWGEERRFILPLRGFILVENVPGKPLHDLFLTSDESGRQELIAAYAALLARLHTLGFYQVVRFKDVICSDAPRENRCARSLTLIDRVVANPGRKPFWSFFCIQALRRGFHRMTRDGIVFNPSERKAFADAYARDVATRWKVTGTGIETRLTR